MLPVLLILSSANVAAVPRVPTMDDVQVIAETRVLAPLISQARDGRHHVEWPPKVETRNISCTAIAKHQYACSYESRVTEMFSNQPSAWEAHREQIVWHKRGWRTVAGSTERTPDPNRQLTPQH